MNFKKKGREREYSREYQRHRRCRNEDVHKIRYNKKLNQHRAELKEKAVAYKGSVCARCGNSFDLVCFDFHHTDHTGKDFNISDILYKTWEEIEAELDKCVLVCSNCHRVIHKEENWGHLTNKKQTEESAQISLFGVDARRN